MAGDSRARLVISIDLELVTRAGSVQHQRQLDALATGLNSLLIANQLPATIAVADPLHSAATEGIVASPLAHEIAVLGDASWVGRGAGRERFARELDRRFHSARAAGLNVTTLALRDVELAENFDLLTQQAIAAIRLRGAGRGNVAQPQLLRFGMWQMPVSLTLPHAPGWFRTTSAIAQRRLAQTLRAGDVFHLHIDAGRMAEQPSSKLVDVERVLELFGAAQSTGQADVVTLRELAASLDRPVPHASQRSILRAA